MRKLFILLLASGWSWAFVVASPVAFADDGADMHTGTFNATWCNYKATIDIESKESGKWVFHGHIRIQKTDQSGQTQVVQTGPPQEKVNNNGAHSAVFTSQRGYGIGCDGTSSTIYVT